MKNIVDVQRLLGYLKDERLVLLDCRFDLDNGQYGREAYRKSHIRGAYYIDLEGDLSGPKGEHGGRHPLPEIGKFVEVLEKLGISNDSIVVIYDDGEFPVAARLWWMMKYIGIDRVYVLEGGFKAWEESGMETTDEIPVVGEKGKLEIKIHPEMLFSIDEVRKNIGNKHAAIIDSRARERYLGIEEPIDKRGGHIPGALNYFWKNILNGNKIKSEDELRDYFKELKKYENIIVHCGSGITACPNIIALDEIDMKPVLYLGGWSDWVSYDENEAVKGE